MTKSKRSVALLLLAAILFGFAFAFLTVGSEADDTAPTLYVNDDVWYKASIYPMRMNKSICVPISIFEQFDGVTVTYYPNNTAMIKRSDNCFISFDFNKDSAMSQNNERFYFQTFLEGNERYLPMLTVCQELGLTHETHTSATDGSTLVRICDGSQTKTFAELLARHNPGALAPVTTPPPATETTVYIDPVENAAFFAVDGLGDWAERLEALLALCDEYGIRGAFFLRPEEIEAKADTVLSLIAGGHSIGLLVEADGALETLAAANAALRSRFHMTTRLVRLSDAEVPEEVDEVLAAAGYSRWGYHIDMGPDEASVRAALIAFRKSLGETGHIVLRVDPNGYNTVGYLREFFNSAKDKRLFFPITPAYLPPVQ